MSISTDYSKDRMAGNGVTTDWTFGFYLVNTDHLRVIRSDSDDVQTVLVKGSDYTVTQNADYVGGTVHYDGGGTPVPEGEHVTIYREVPLEQPYSFKNQSAFFEDRHENAYDYLMMAIQQLSETLSRALTVSITSGESGSDLDSNFDTIVSDSESARDAAVAAQLLSEAAKAIALAAGSAAVVAQAAAEAARDAVVSDRHDETAVAAQQTITVSGFVLNTDTNQIMLYVDNVRQHSFTRTSDTVITLDSPLSGGEVIVLYNYAAAGSGAIDIIGHETTYDHSLLGGTLAIAKGGTGATTAAGARTNLGLGTMAVETATGYLAKSGGTMTGDIAFTTDTLTDGATIDATVANGPDKKVSINGTRTMNNWTIAAGDVGKEGTLAVTQGTGGDTMVWDTYFDWGGEGAVTLSTTAGKTDILWWKIMSTTLIRIGLAQAGE